MDAELAAPGTSICTHVHTQANKQTAKLTDRQTHTYICPHA